MMPLTKNDKKKYGPMSVDPNSYITREQQELIRNQMRGLWPEIACKKKWGHLVGPTYTRQCKACFGQNEVYTVRSTYPVCTTMSVCSSRDSPSHEV